MADEDSSNVGRQDGGGAQQTLIDVLRWIRDVEELAALAYGEATARFTNDTHLSTFLAHMADDEASHRDAIDKALELSAEVCGAPACDITVDSEARERIVGLLDELRAEVARPEASKARVLDCLLRAEFSEWNDVFVYTLLKYQKHSKEFQELASTIQTHEECIEAFVRDLSEDVRPAVDLRGLPTIWHRRLLVVDDDPVILDLLETILSRQANVTTVSSGREALELIAQHFFDVIISDIKMPEMDGCELLERACGLDPSLRERFILCSGSPDDPARAGAWPQGVRRLPKPVSLARLKATVASVIAEAG